jgi:hypothetical protein
MKRETLSTIGTLLQADPTVSEENTGRLLEMIQNPKKPKPKDLISTKEAAAILKIHPKSLWRWQALGYIQPIRYTARRVRWNFDDVERLAVEGTRVNQ